MSMKKVILATLVVLFAAVFTVGAGSVPAEAKWYRANLATATTGGTYYPLGNALAQIWSKNLDKVKVAAQATAGTPQNVELMKNEEVQIAFGQNGVCYYAYTGTGTFEGKQPLTQLRGMLSLYPNVMQFVVRKGSGIQSVADFRDREFVPGAVASATEVNSREILQVYGLNYMKDQGETQVKADFVGYNEASDLIKNNQTDGALIAGGAPTAAVIDMLSTGQAELLSLEEDKIQAICETYPWYFPFTIKAGTYPKQDKDIRTVALSNILFTSASQPEEFIYNLTKAVYDYHDKLVTSHKAATSTTLENALNGMTLPLHPGSLKYFQEQGLDIPAKLIAQ